MQQLTCNIDLSCSFYYMSGGAHYLPKFLPISFFRRASRFIGVSGHLALNKGNPSVSWHATLSCPWSQMMQIRISFRSRSDLVLDADHALDFLSDLAFQACISFIAF